MQKSITVIGSSTNELDEALGDGWKVIHMCAMPSSCAVAMGADTGYGVRRQEFPPQCLVIVEKL